MEIRIVVLGLLLALGACGGESEGVASSSSAKASSSASSSSKLDPYMSVDKVCDLLSMEQLQSMFNVTTEVEKNPIDFQQKRFICTYTWARSDAAERQKNMASSMIASMSGDGPKMTMRDMSLEHQVTISLQKHQRSADSFVPRKLSEEEMNQQIATVKKRADEALTDEQKKVAGDMANTMVERILRKNNENVEVSGIGDAAYWTDLGTGSLEFLAGNVKVSLSPTIADTKEGDFENAKKIASAMLE